jgi:hypothetical protein
MREQSRARCHQGRRAGIRDGLGRRQSRAADPSSAGPIYGYRAATALI